MQHNGIDLKNICKSAETDHICIISESLKAEKYSNKLLLGLFQMDHSKRIFLKFEDNPFYFTEKDEIHALVAYLNTGLILNYNQKYLDAIAVTKAAVPTQLITNKKNKNIKMYLAKNYDVLLT